MALTTICCAHKLHSVAAKTWTRFDPLFKGAFKTLKALQSPGALPKLVAELVAACEEVQIVTTPLTDDAIAYRGAVVELFSPNFTDKPRNASALKVLIEVVVFTGDWWQKKLQHLCRGCCRDRNHTIETMKSLMPRLVRCLQVSTLNTGNWANWRCFATRDRIPHTLASLISKGLRASLPIPSCGSRGACGSHSRGTRSTFLSPESLPLIPRSLCSIGDTTRAQRNSTSLPIASALSGRQCEHSCIPHMEAGTWSRCVFLQAKAGAGREHHRNF